MSDIWVLSDSRTGNLKQALALAESVKKESGLSYEIKEIVPKLILRHLPNFVIPRGLLACRSDNLQAPYPRLIIGCGRVSAHVGLAIKQIDERVKLVQILNPTARAEEFDLIIVPRHDMRAYDNGLVTGGALTDITSESLMGVRRKFADIYGGNIRKPILGVLIGGSNKAYRFNLASMNNITDLLEVWVQAGYHIIGTFSRRTPRALQERLLSMEGVDFWNGEGANPYLGILAYACGFAVTCDSINMISEAYHTGKPTYIIELEDNGSHKFSRFHDFQLSSGRIRLATGVLDFGWSPPHCDDLLRATDAVFRLL